MNALAKIERAWALREMLGLADALVAIRRNPEDILESTAIAGARVERDGWLIKVEFDGVAERTVTDAAEAVSFWRRRARREIARRGANA